MNIELLLRLDGARSSSLAELRARDARLAAALDDVIEKHVDDVIAERMRAAPPALVDAVRQRVRPPRGTKPRPLGDLAKTPALAAAAKQRRLDLQHVERVSTRTDAALPLTANAALLGILGRARVAAVATAAGLPAASAQRVSDRFANLGAIEDDALAAMVEARELEAPLAQRVGRAVSITNLVEDDALANALIAETRSPRDLAKLDVAAWQGSITRARATHPELTTDVWAAALAERAAALYPTTALVASLARARDTETARRATLAMLLHDQNPDIDLLALDFSRDGERPALATAGLGVEDQATALQALAGYQRVFALAGSVELASSVIAAGYDSAARVAMEAKATFVQTTGLTEVAADLVYAKSQSKVAELSAQFGTIIDAVSGGFADLAVGNLGSTIKNYLKDLDGFEEIFGSQASCRCEHCQSITSPAAYFVDTMHFVQKHVSGVYFTGARASHPLALAVRRPDLWKLELTCANTNDLLPTLDVINEILENYIAQRGGYAGPLSNRTAIEDLVYRQTLAVRVDSFRQPLHLPLARLDTYLAHFGEDRGTIASAIDAPADVIARGRLQLSPAEHALVIQPNVDPVFLRRIYTLPLAVAGGNITPFDAHDLLAPMGVTREELGDLVASTFVRASTPVAIQIRAEKTSAESVQNDIERIRNLTFAALDRMHRFLRTQRALRWTVRELDLVMSELAIAELDGDALARLARFSLRKQELGLSLDETLAMTGRIPDRSATTKPSLFARLFNVPFFVQTDGTLPKDAERFVHPALRSGPPTPPSATHARILAGLRLADEDLLRLITALETPLGSDLDAADVDARGFALTADNLSLLYRHARLAAFWKLDIADLFRMLRHCGLTHVATEADLAAARAHYAWWKPSKYALDAIDLALGIPPRDPSTLPDPNALAAKIVADVKSGRGLLFAETVFAFFPGVTEAQSRAIIMANPSAILDAPGNAGYWIAADHDPLALLAIPPGTPVTPALATAHVLRHHASQILPARIAAELAIALPLLEQMLALAGIDLGSAPFTSVLQETEPPAALAAVIQALLPLRAVFASPAWDVEALAFVRARPDVFEIASVTTLAVASLRKLAVYARFADSASAFTTAPPIAPADVRGVLSTFVPAQGFAATDLGQLARVLRAEPGLVSTVLLQLTLPPSAPDALVKLASAVALAQQLGVSGDTLRHIVAADYGEIQQAAGAVLAAFRAKHPDEKRWLEELAPFDDKIRQRRRDGLVDHLLHSLAPDLFETEDDLYHHFLIDVELCGCARTSRLVAAISSVQLYVHRILMNLEQDRRPASDPQHLAVPASSIPQAEWVWRKNYRVWEANRKVFLWPENYIEPELRDDKSPEFIELESALMQQEITDQTVLDVYARYLASFDEIAKLKIAGAYHDIHVGSGDDVLHLFGVAPGDPPIYYYRTATNVKHAPRETRKGETWSPWRKIDAQIPATRVGVTVYKSRLHVFWTEHRARSVNQVVNGDNKFGGYRHTMRLKMIAMRLDGTWTPPQDVTLPGQDSLWPFGPSAGEIMDTFPTWDDPHPNSPRLDFDERTHDEPIDDYMLKGPNWEAIYLDDDVDEYPGQLNIVGRNYCLVASLDLFRRRTEDSNWPLMLDGDTLSVPILGSRDEDRTANGKTQKVRVLYAGSPARCYANRNAYADLVLDDRRIDRFNHEYNSGDLREGLYAHRLFDSKPGHDLALTSIDGATGDAVIQDEDEVLYVQRASWLGTKYTLRRIGSTLSGKLNERLFSSGVEGMLATSYQLGLGERSLPLQSLTSRITNAVKSKPLAYGGPAGVYYREIFFHIPFLIANTLNAQGNYQGAMRWYQYIFDPTAPEKTTPATDRNWRYAEFRKLGVTSLRDMLTDADAIAVYKDDPFNPHAIARLRLSAYQKCVVMKFVDNLLDWGDALFSQFTMESVGEATLLYVMASDILGPRPAELGECGEGAIQPKTYEKLAPLFKHGSELLLELETWTIGKKQPVVAGKASSMLAKSVVSAQLAAYAPAHAMKAQATTTPRATAMAVSNAVLGKAVAARVPLFLDDDETAPGVFRGASWKTTKIGSWKTAPSASVSKVYEHAATLVDKARLSSFGLSLVSQINPAFCVPANKDLRAYWDRVEDRLFKIRNCMDLSGVKRELSLFAPEIDPRMLVRMRAAGLSLDDVLASLSGNLPPYRFAFLVERAKQAAASLQGYGSALLSALEKKDGEELGRLRTVHQQHMLQLTTKTRRLEIEAAETAIEALERQQETIEFRRDYYQGLVDGGLNGAEKIQTEARLKSTLHTVNAALMDIVASVLHLIPQAGSPFAMKFGGLELGSSAKAWSDFVRLMGGVWDSISVSAGLIGGFERRAEGWEHQRDLAAQDLKPIAKHLEAARIRRDMAEHAMVQHDAAITQTEEVFDFLREKFTNQALYTFLATSLQRVYRDAYHSAHSLAKLAEQAFRFERPDDDAPGLEPTYWDSTHAGFLAGEKLLNDLNALERHFIETNYRMLEVDQPFSITQLDPRALLQLRETGTCEISIPELFFDLYYPGQYNRRIKHVKLTIPCITGPYTNVSATLTLLASQVRSKPTLGADALVDVPPRRSVSVAASTAQSDAGVFELSFRDERYMPFEGLGAISRWQISLPKNFRPFDYQTINDVILTISYTARDAGELRTQVEAQNAALEGTLANTLSSQPLGRLFSLRQDFASAFHRLLHGPAGTAVPIEITDKYFPMFLAGRQLVVSNATLVLRTADNQAAGAFAIQIGAATHTGFAPSATLGNLFARDLGGTFAGGIVGTHVLAIANAGALASETPGSALDARKLEDMLLYVEYTIA